VFEKGDNTEPSNMAYDSRHPRAREALESMERELAAAPTADGLANLAETYSLAKMFTQGLAAIERGLALWPNDVTLLLSGFRVAEAAGDRARADAYMGRAMAQAPNDPGLAEIRAKTRRR
jgi:tetratricopeptide (TPR) repeat protein